jgi:hypothetical protein
MMATISLTTMTLSQLIVPMDMIVTIRRSILLSKELRVLLMRAQQSLLLVGIVMRMLCGVHTVLTHQ